MQFMLQPDIAALKPPISYADRILLIGSCFTEHIYDRLQQYKFTSLSNPHGILFNPLSVAGSLNSYLDDKRYTATDLFHLNELWNSWDHHTRFSNTDKEVALAGINQHQASAATFIRTASVVIVTLGSAFQYYLHDGDRPVANNHRAPAQWFRKTLLDIDVITSSLAATIDKLASVNPSARVIFTISPVRHIRDGVVDNNRSKARLIEAVHTLCARYANAWYFPAYELVIDVLRDYRFYDIDFVHPNYQATSFVWEQFVHACIAPGIQGIMQQVQEITTARGHRPRFPGTAAHQKFMQSYAARITALLQAHPYLDLSAELAYFSGQNE